MYNIEKLFKGCAEIALCFPWRLTDPIGIYSQLEFADQSKQMHAKLYRVWLSKRHEYPWALDPKSTQAFIDEHDPQPKEE